MRTRELVDVEVVADGLAFPEGPVPMPDGSVLVVEIAAGRLTRVEPDGSKQRVAELGGGPNGAAIGPDGAAYICNNGGISKDRRSQPCIQRVDLATGEWTVLYTESESTPFGAPNDLVFDAAGGFWFTDFRGGSVHYALPDGSSVHTVERRVPRPNGIGLSPAGDVLYWAQTQTRQVMRRKVTAPGTVTPSTGSSISSLMTHGSIDPYALLVGLPDRQELDSLAVDSSGAVCVGTLVDSGITEVGPDGGLDSVVRWTLPDGLQDGAVTNIAFGGPHLTDAYLTASLTGRLLRCRWPRAGLRLHHAPT